MKKVELGKNVKLGERLDSRNTEDQEENAGVAEKTSSDKPLFMEMQGVETAFTVIATIGGAVFIYFLVKYQMLPIFAG